MLKRMRASQQVDFDSIDKVERLSSLLHELETDLLNRNIESDTPYQILRKARWECSELNGTIEKDRQELDKHRLKIARAVEVLNIVDCGSDSCRVKGDQ